MASNDDNWRLHPSINRSHWDTGNNWIRKFVQKHGDNLGIDSISRMRGHVEWWLDDRGWKPDPETMRWDRVWRASSVSVDSAIAELGRRVRGSSYSRVEEAFLKWFWDQPQLSAAAEKKWDERETRVTEHTLRKVIRKLIKEVAGPGSSDM